MKKTKVALYDGEIERFYSLMKAFHYGCRQEYFRFALRVCWLIAKKEFSAHLLSVKWERKRRSSPARRTEEVLLYLSREEAVFVSTIAKSLGLPKNTVLKEVLFFPERLLSASRSAPSRSSPASSQILSS